MEDLKSEDLNEDKICTITKHAYDRAKERLKWKRTVLDKMAEKAFLSGIKHSQTKGALKKHITNLWFKYKSANNIRIYGQNIYFFAGVTLVTLYRLPNNLIKYLKNSK